MTKPTSPVPKEPADNWEHTALYRRVRKALSSVPVYFKTETVISGVMAGDLHTLGTLLGATVEEQVVQTLNEVRTVWDPKGEYQLYSFVRQGQTFPDVLLRSGENDADVIMGIELKS